jgi:tetratricopeptide (TPR) repeat protein
MMSPHRDVLEATPDTAESKARLVEELQSRGRAAVGAKSWMDAKLLYEKALTVMTGDDDDDDDVANKKAVLHSNLSLVEKNMGLLEPARQAAENATQDDPTYVKGWWRLGQALIALHRSKDALEALNKAKSLDPTNKALIKEVEKVQKQVDEEEALMQVENDKTEEAATNTTTTTPAPAPKATTKSSSTVSSSTDKMDVDDDDDAKLFTKSEPVRGYKVVNGKKTSYFHNELDDKAKALIGDIAPKKLDNPPPSTDTAAKQGGTSAWNQAGTWEEKNVSAWAKETLTKAILQTTFTLPATSPAPNALVTVQKVKSLDGHASVAVVRGKTRFIYEYSCRLEWQLQQSSDGDSLKCKGSLAIPDIDGTIAPGEGYEIHEFVVDSVSDNAVKPMIDRFVHRGGFHEALNESIDDWVRLFRKEHGPK